METSFLFLQPAAFSSQIGEGEAVLSKEWEISTSNLQKNVVKSPV